MQIHRINNIYTAKKQSFKRTPGMTAGAGGRIPQDENRPPKNGFELIDAVYWIMIANTLGVNPIMTKMFQNHITNELQQYERDAQTYDVLQQARNDIEAQNKTSNAFFHLNLFNEVEMPKLKRLDDSLYMAKFNTVDTKVTLTFSTDELDKNIVSGEIEAQKGNLEPEMYTYKINLDTLGSKSFDIELKAENDSNSIKQTYIRDNSGNLYYLDKENNKKIPVNEYSVTRYNDKNNLETEMSKVDRAYHESQQFNYILCLIATMIQMSRHSSSRRREE